MSMKRISWAFSFLSPYSDGHAFCVFLGSSNVRLRRNVLTNKQDSNRPPHNWFLSITRTCSSVTCTRNLGLSCLSGLEDPVAAANVVDQVCDEALCARTNHLVLVAPAIQKRSCSPVVLEAIRSIARIAHSLRMNLRRIFRKPLQLLF